jgi:hypothetical protein
VDGNFAKNDSNQSVIEESILGIGQWEVLIVPFFPRHSLCFSLNAANFIPVAAGFPPRAAARSKT